MIKNIIFGLMKRYGNKSEKIVNGYNGLAEKYPDVILDIAHRGFVFTTTADSQISKEQVLIREGRRQLALEILRLIDPNLPNIIYKQLHINKKDT